MSVVRSLAGVTATGGGANAAASGLAESAAALSAAFAPLNTGVGVFAESLKGVTSAVGGLAGRLQSAGSGLGQFVEAFAPALVSQFNLAMRNLTALVGSALAPAMGVLVGVVKDVGATLAPVFERLAVILRPLAESLGGMAVNAVAGVAKAFVALSPVIETAVNVMIPLVEGLSAMGQAVGVVAASLAGAFSGGLDPKRNGLVTLADSLKSLMERLAQGLILVVAAVAKWAGANGVLDSLVKNLKPKPEGAKDITGMAAVQNAQYSSFGDFGRRMALAASTAMGGSDARPKDTNQWLEEVAKEVQAIKQGTKSVEQVLKDWGESFLANKLVESMSKALAEALRAWWPRPSFDGWGLPAAGVGAAPIVPAFGGGGRGPGGDFGGGGA